MIFAIAGFAGSAAQAAWDRAHGNSTNDGFIDLATSRAAAPQAVIALGGVVADGAGPVVGPDGTVYLGVNRKGKPGKGIVMAFHADGSKAWSRELPAGQMIRASPAVGADGSVYVVGVTEVKEGPAGAISYKATLHKFLGGGWLWQMPIPVRPGQGPTSAPLNIWNSGGVEVLMLPIVYLNKVTTGVDMRLLAFSTDAGGVLADQLVAAFVPEVSGSGPPPWRVLACVVPTAWIPCLFDDGTFSGRGEPLPPDTSKDKLPRFELPQPGAAIFTYPGGGTPWIVVSDRISDLVGYTFSPNAGFQERFRVRDETRFLRSPPTILPDAHAVIAGSGQLLFAGPNANKVPAIEGVGTILASPTRTADGRVVLVETGGELLVVSGGTLVSQVPLGAQSLAAAAASRTHVFVSTASGLLTFDAGGMQQVGKFDWLRGGLSPPAIGNEGQVYAVADNKLFVFTGSPGVQRPEPVDPVLGIDEPAVAPDGTASQGGGATMPSLNRYDQPSGPSGLRLYACTSVGGDECERPVADAFCQGRGWTRSAEYDTDSEKIRAETLSGQVCSKKRCRVFDYIKCRN